MEAFIRGPLVWLAFIVFFGGCLLQLLRFRHLAKKDKIMFPRMGLRYSLLSFLTWFLNFFSANIKKRPVLTIGTVVFHICLFVTPIFLYAHVVLFYDAWDIMWWALPDKTADVMTMIVIAGCLLFVLRRVFLKEVRYVTSFSDYILLALVMAPFMTGLFAYHQWVTYQPMLIAHILSGELLLIALPFSRLSHMLFVFFTQAYMGSEFDAVRILKK